MWIVIALIVALAGAVTLVVYALGLRHRYESVMHELQIVSGRADEAVSLLRSVDVATLRRD